MTSDGDPTITAECPAGAITGLDRGSTMVFKGVRFAAAERFGAPADVTAWTGSYDATSFRAQAPQLSGALEQMLGGSKLPTSEDCLHLNVTTPACDDGARPVLFWVHGGAYTTGGGAMPWYDGSHLAARGDVVVVSINYRLGVLGFLGRRNSGLLDQVSALRWVARNIAAFGGDPDNVTVFGESAGGSAVIALAATPTATGLFHRTIAMSPSIQQFRSGEAGDRNEAAVLEAVGVDDVGSLTDVPLERLMDAQRELLAVPSPGARTFSPTESSDALPGRIVDVTATDPRPLVIGTTLDEANLFAAFDPRRLMWTDRDIEREFARVFGELGPYAIETYRAAKPAVSASALVAAMETDEMFRVTARRLADDRAAAAAPTWMYLFDYATPAFGGVLGSCHALDIPFAFDNLDRPGVELFTGSGSDRRAVADQFSDEVLRFARSGAVGWTPYDSGSRPTQLIGNEPRVEADPERARRELWESRSS
jgi:para-nitrobenzyl esterase